LVVAASGSLASQHDFRTFDADFAIRVGLVWFAVGLFGDGCEAIDVGYLDRSCDEMGIYRQHPWMINLGGSQTQHG
jgi:hypothetical protein